MENSTSVFNRIQYSVYKMEVEKVFVKLNWTQSVQYATRQGV